MELLLMIKQHALNYHEHRYEMSIMLDSLRSLFNLRQKDGESLQDIIRNDLKQLVMFYVLILEDQLY